MISWLRRKKMSMALNIREAEYIAASVSSREAIWLWKIRAGLFDQELEMTLIHCYNKSCVNIS